MIQSQVDLLGVKRLHELELKFTICGQELRFMRARLGDHLRLSMILKRFTDEMSQGRPEKALDYVQQYIVAAAGSAVALDVRELDFMNMLQFTELVELNSVHITLAMHQEGQEQSTQVYAYEYPERLETVWYHKLAYAYGWSYEEISDLIPEQALCFLQEIALERASEQEWQYTLSDAGMKTQPDGKTAVKQPFPKPQWMQPRTDPKIMRETRRLPKSLMPVGLVIGEEKRIVD